ncbi:amidohydrolase family protein [Pseudomonas sp. 10B1]|uniref:amidohydrolase family protein n=1 Tax=unclassified Pseudomonas TaxID=196821 RepID=UPI002AB389AB|nr:MULTISPECIES: amidohydrolase family protein [unclassified Pseudomonas]MDY7559683.1 amidohydrolase family protein [Pseudomonas sp. AB6]MEA9993081.1 amidohydrolase family protein [Pseudomonas sp. AA4]MEB0086023.1 amidohydrolase family protein [Pseudomonas sp. RTI1]MEB0125541.1 amidohydrolase family protein [Pseudomonas sp. CCC1.2]MEB0151666.1 amidohydrolase family protein [Pseudomonas sp. CCC4.3]
MPDICRSASPLPILGVDAHAHVFSRALSMAWARRYSPGYDATLDQYLTYLRVSGLSHGVLVQPSFLGTDNSYLLSALQQAPIQLRGVAVVDTGISREMMMSMAEQGIVGIRLNLMGQALPDFTDPKWKSLLSQVSALGWHVELHRDVEDLPMLLSALMAYDCKIVIDHFGRPDALLGVEQPAFAQLLELGLSGRVWLKVSGIYRLGGDLRQNLTFAQEAMPLLIRAFGTKRLVWGSDWPHTQFEGQMDYGSAVEQRRQLGWSAQVEQAILVDAPRSLFGLACL